MDALVLGQMKDEQTGIYILYALNSLGVNVKGIDTRDIIDKYDKYQLPMILNNELNNIKYSYEDFDPAFILILKGLEFDLTMLRELRERFPKAKLVNWFFDKYLEDKPIYESKNYFNVIKYYDYYYCSLKGVADKLKEQGFENVHFLPEACHEDFHSEQIMNAYQEAKYGSDIAFIGSIGFHTQHPERINTLSKVIKEGFDTKIWGSVVGDKKRIPREIWDSHALESVVNENHSMVCQASNIVLGIDQDTELELGFSARLYRVLAAGGLYLTNYTPKLEDWFIINLKGEPITAEQDLVVYYDLDDLINKIDFLLNPKNASIVESIKKNGKEEVLEGHTFKKRLERMLSEVFPKNGDDNE